MDAAHRIFIAVAIATVFGVAAPGAHGKPHQKPPVAVAPLPREVKPPDWDEVARKFKAPCDPKKFPKRELILHGESHNTSVTALHRALRLFQADKQVCVLAQEGIVCGDEKSKNSFLADYAPHLSDPKKALVFGVEDAPVYALSALLVYQLVLGSSDENSDAAKYYEAESIVKYIPSSAFLREAWQNLRARKNKFGKEAEKIAELIDLGNKMDAKDYHKRVDEANEKTPFKKQRDALFELLGPLADESADLITGKYAKSTFPPDGLKAKIQIFKEKSDELGTTLIKAIFLENVVVEWRDLHMAMHIARAYCEALRLEKPFHAMVGRRHLDGISSFLKIQFGDQVSIRATNYEKDVEEAKDFARNLKKWLGLAR